MAYLDSLHAFSQANAFPVAMPEELRCELAEAKGFAPTEWTVISLARQDGLASLHEARRSKLARLLLGQPRSYQLSGERLEALRALAVEAWHQPLAISLRALGGFIAAGFSNAQLALLLDTTGALSAMARQNAVPIAVARNCA